MQKKFVAQRGANTHDPEIKSLMLYWASRAVEILIEYLINCFRLEMFRSDSAQTRVY